MSNQWTVETRNPVLAQEAERMLATGLRQALRLTRLGRHQDAQRALGVALAAAELLDADKADS